LEENWADGVTAGPSGNGFSVVPCPKWRLIAKKGAATQRRKLVIAQRFDRAPAYRGEDPGR